MTSRGFYDGLAKAAPELVKESFWDVRFPFPPKRERLPQLVSFDTETTGRGEGARVVQFGAVVADPQTLIVTKTVCFLIGLGDDLEKDWSEDAARVNGITKTDLRGKPTFAEKATEVYDILNGSVWIGYNIERFDIPLLRAEFRRANRPFPRPTRILDVFCIAAAWKLETLTEDLKLNTCSRYFGFGTELHRADDDAAKTLQVLLRMIDLRVMTALAVDPTLQLDVDSIPPPTRDAPLPPPDLFKNPRVFVCDEIPAMRMRREPALPAPPDAVTRTEDVVKLFCDVLNANHSGVALDDENLKGFVCHAMYVGYDSASGGSTTYLLYPIRCDRAVGHFTDLFDCPMIGRFTDFANETLKRKTFAWNRFRWAKLAKVIGQ